MSIYPHSSEVRRHERRFSAHLEESPMYDGVSRTTKDTWIHEAEQEWGRCSSGWRDEVDDVVGRGGFAFDFFAGLFGRLVVAAL